LTLLQQTGAEADSTSSSGPAETLPSNGTAATLLACAKSGDILSAGGLEVTTSWKFRTPRDVFPWLFLKLTPRRPGKPVILSRGLCSPESSGPVTTEIWRITPTGRIAPGQYTVEGFFVDNSRRLWLDKAGKSDQPSLLTATPVSLGELTVTTIESSAR
jgi:hypothetical protein